MESAGTTVTRGEARKKRSATSHALGDNLFLALTAACAAVINGVLLTLVILLWSSSSSTFSTFGLGFLWGSVWSPSTNVFGAAPFVYGTLVTSALALLIGVPLSLGIAVFLTELAPAWLSSPLSFLVELLAAVPSVVYGLWGIFVLVPFMASTVNPGIESVLGTTPIFSSHSFGASVGQGYLTAGVILAIMIVPTISALSRDALSAVPQSQREAALSLGATRWEATRVSVLSYARVGIFGAIILGLGRAMGETIAVTMTIGNSNAINNSLLSPGQTIASLIANEFNESAGLHKSALLEIALVLLLMSLVVNLLARFVLWRFTRPSGGG